MIFLIALQIILPVYGRPLLNGNQIRVTLLAKIVLFPVIRVIAMWLFCASFGRFINMFVCEDRTLYE